MSAELKLDCADPDLSDWPTLSRNFQDLKSGKFHNTELKESIQRNLTRSQDDIGALDTFKSVENRLTSLAKNQASIIEKRIVSSKDHPYPKVIDVMDDCLDLQLIVDQHENENFDLLSHGSTAFSKLCRIAGISSDLMKSLQQQYNLFKFRVLGIIKDENTDIRVKYEHILFEVHQCDDSYNTRLKKGCALFNKLKQPLRLINMKVLHLFLKEESLYSGIELFLSIFVKCAVKLMQKG